MADGVIPSFFNKTILYFSNPTPVKTTTLLLLLLLGFQAAVAQKKDHSAAIRAAADKL